MALISRVLLLVRSPKLSAEFYSILGLQVIISTEQLVQMQAGPVRLDLVASASEAALSTGYSPVLSFLLPPDQLATCVPQLIMRGAHLDGGIQHRSQEAIACLRTPDGHMIALIEPQPVVEMR